MGKFKITPEEAANEKRLIQDLTDLVAYLEEFIDEPYISTLPYYKDKLKELKRDTKELRRDAKQGFATADRE